MARPLSVLRSAWGACLFYSLGVVLFGAVVRITGSGAGCGQHWPTCHGEVTHLPRSVETLIEYTHRLTSGLSLLFVVVLTVWTFRRWPRGHLARRAAAWSSAFFVTESLVGAALVLLRLVGKTDSITRAVVMAVHLVNTSLLLGAVLLATWTFAWKAPPRLSLRSEGARLGLAGALVLLVISAAGAVTALGDTLYPVETAGLSVARDALSEGAHFLERVRGFHPLLALFGGVFLAFAAGRVGRPSVVRSSVPWIVAAQFAFGFLNVALSAPGWLQVVHLGAANVLWLAWMWITFDAWLSPDEESSPVHQPTSASPRGMEIS